MNTKLVYWNSQEWSDNCSEVLQLDMNNSMFIINDNVAGGGKLFFPSSVKLLVMIYSRKDIYVHVYWLGITVMFDC